MKGKWICPNCQIYSTRHWNLQRHIQRRHGGMGEPISQDTMQYFKDMNLQNLRFPLDYSYASLSSSKEKPQKKFSDLLEDQVLQPLRKVVEFKNLVSQLSVIPRQQQRIWPASGVYSNMPSRFDHDNLEIIGYRGNVCEKCLIISIDIVFRHNDQESGQIETKHRCNSKRLFDIQLQPDKAKTTTNQHDKLIEYMKKKVNTWTKNSAYVVAIEIPQNAVVNNCFDITPTDENHWAARAIKNKLTILNDEEISDFLCKAGNATCAYFKVISAYSQQRQQQQNESSTRSYLMMITDSKIKDSFGQLLQYIKDN
jgi:hypothetical protein